jgi:hypothetical protein
VKTGIQLVKPKAKLEITGNLTYFAYPFGLWNKEAIPEVKERIPNGFILSAKEIQSIPHHQTYDCFWYLDY